MFAFAISMQIPVGLSGAVGSWLGFFWYSVHMEGYRMLHHLCFIIKMFS